MAESGAPLVQVRDLKVHFPIKSTPFSGKTDVVHAVDGVSFSVKRGTAFGLVGESGSGKTTVAMATVRLIDPTQGSIQLDGTDVSDLKGEELRLFRQKMQIIFQDPYSSLNPRERAGAIVGRPLELMKIGTAKERSVRVAELFRLVGLRPEQQSLFPHQFSGGQRQRIGIARALASQPALVVCDEPVSALDVAIQAQILNLLMRLKAEFSLTYLFISHDLGVIQHVCDEIAVMYLGKIIEQGSRREIFAEPLHPYTLALISAVPSAETDLDRGAERVRLGGEPPSPIDLPTGCRFAGRCPFAIAQCHETEPDLRSVKDGHLIACHRVSESGEKTFHQ